MIKLTIEDFSLTTAEEQNNYFYGISQPKTHLFIGQNIKLKSVSKELKQQLYLAGFSN